MPLLHIKLPMDGTYALLLFFDACDLLMSPLGLGLLPFALLRGHGGPTLVYLSQSASKIDKQVPKLKEATN